MKATLTFNLPEDQADFNRANKALDAFLALSDIADEVFRPARKHGYAWTDANHDCARLNELLLHREDEPNSVAEAIGILERMFYKIVNERNVNPSQNLE